MITVLGLLSGCVKDFDHPPKATEESADVVYDWYKLIAQIQLISNPSPVLQNYRNFGFVGVGLYEAVQPGINGAVSLSTKLYQMPAMPTVEPNKDYLWGASANAYFPSMFKQILSGLTNADKVRMDSLENAYNNRFRLSTSDAVVNRSQAFGRSIATAIYKWSTTDNFNLSGVGYTIPVFPGSWVPTPPAFVAPVGPFLANSRPFLAYSLTATAPPLPFPYSEDPSSQFYKAAKEVYDVGKALTAEQKRIANWWGGGPGATVHFAAGAHAISIATQILESKKAKLGQAAQTYAKTSIAFKDGPIIVWRAKFKFNLVRPITYINRLIDPGWQAYLVTPPYPDYTSGLAGIITPFMQVLKREFGDLPLTDNTYVWRGDGSRQYASISALVREAANSRFYAGIHYQFTQDISVELGQKLGNNIADINLVAYREKEK
ncbi:vanadium-dependent haloperoxidase [Flavitalea antarctica]